MEPGAATVLGAVESLRTAATVSYDPNVRPELMGDHASAVRRVERCVALSDVVKASDEDLEGCIRARSRNGSPTGGWPPVPRSCSSPGAATERWPYCPVDG